MAKVTDELKVNISVESLFQNELMGVVKKIYEEHGLMINSIQFNWLHSVGEGAQLTGCDSSCSCDMKND